MLADAVLGSARYETDRGPRVLPTWEVHAQGVFHAIHVLDPALISSGQVWEPPGRKRIGGRRPEVTLGSDSKTLTMSFTGDSSASIEDGPARTVESGNAVALMNMETHRPRRAGPVAGGGVRREVTAVLERPLGNRVLLDVKGAPVIVSYLTDSGRHPSLTAGRLAAAPVAPPRRGGGHAKAAPETAFPWRC